MLAGVCSDLLIQTVAKFEIIQIFKFAGKFDSDAHRRRRALDYDIKLILSHNKASLY